MCSRNIWVRKLLQAKQSFAGDQGQAGFAPGDPIFDLDKDDQDSSSSAREEFRRMTITDKLKSQNPSQLLLSGPNAYSKVHPSDQLPNQIKDLEFDYMMQQQFADKRLTVVQKKSTKIDIMTDSPSAEQKKNYKNM